MTDLSGTAMERTWHSLRRRKVVQWVLGYAAAAWTLLQVIEYFGETYAWPPAVRQIAALALPLGVSFVAVVAWFHGDRGEQRVSRTELAILAVLALGLGAMLWLYVSRLDEAAWIADDGLPPVRHVVPQDAASVAVLPFVNMSADPEQEYFADGLSEELLNTLARTPGLYVPARTSSFQFKGKAGDVAKFAALLGVAHVLEGSVRKAEGRVRITAQLVKADDGYHVWSQTYDRELKDIFAIQSEIASAITEALKLRLTAQQKQAATLAPPTSNMDAYEAYLLGRYEWETKTGPKRVENAMAHLQKAVALDPQFADAYALLARVSLGIGNNFLPTAEGRALSDEYLRKAQALAPDRPLVLAVSGQMLYHGRTLSAPKRDENGELTAAEKTRLERVLDYYDRALAADPNQVRVIRMRAQVLRQLGRPGSALAAVEEELKRNPLDANTLLGGIYHLAIRGRSAEAAPLVDRLMAISPAQAHQQQAIHAFFFRGDIAGAARHWLLLYDLEQGTNPGTVSWLAGLFAVMGWQEEALHAAQAAPDSSAQTRIYVALGEYRKAAEAIRPTVTEYQWANACDLGNVLYLVPDLEGSQAAFATCWEKGEPTPGVGASRMLMAADVERRLGNEAQARKYYRWFDESLRLWLADGIVPDRYLMAMYEAYGKHDEAALEHLVAAVTLDPWGAAELRSYPMLAELVKRPEFRAAVERGRPRMERERAEVLQMLCGPHPVSTMYRPAPATCAKQSGP